MTPEIVPIGLGQLFVGLGFIIVAGITSLLHSLKLERDLLVRKLCLNKVMGWLADHQLTIGEFKAKAYKILADANFAENAVEIKTQTKKTNILNDIVQESYQEYNAVVVGRTGISRSKDLIVGSLAGKIVKIIKHIPTIIVGGSPTTRRILIALDESIEAMRGVNSVGVLAGSRDADVTLCHITKLPSRFHLPGSQSQSAEKGQQWLEYRKNKFKPYMDEATGPPDRSRC